MSGAIRIEARPPDEFDDEPAALVLSGSAANPHSLPAGEPEDAEGDDTAGDDGDAPAGDVGTLLTIEGAAREIGCSRETLRRGLRELGLETAKGTLFNLRQIFRALSSDAKAERARVDRERADKLARERMVDERELFPAEAVLSFVNAVLLPVRQSILEMPPALCQRVNSADPEHAYGILLEWADEFLAGQRAAVETAKAKLAEK